MAHVDVAVFETVCLENTVQDGVSEWNPKYNKEDLGDSSKGLISTGMSNWIFFSCFDVSGRCAFFFNTPFVFASLSPIITLDDGSF